VVAVGDGLVVGAPASPIVSTVAAAAPAAAEDVARPEHPGVPAVERARVAAEKSEPTVPGGWVSVLADCLDERQPGDWVVLDRSADGETTSRARQDVAAVRELDPGVVLVGVGVPDGADQTTFRADLAALVHDLRAEDGPEVLLVGLIPPTLSQIPDSHASQADADRRAHDWDAALDAVATTRTGVEHVDLLAGWPADADARARLTVHGTRLSDQGHARVAAQVCDAVIAWQNASEP